jgi:hypothetical protein
MELFDNFLIYIYPLDETDKEDSDKMRHKFIEERRDAFITTIMLMIVFYFTISGIGI